MSNDFDPSDPLEMRKAALQEKVDKFLLTLTRNQRRTVKKLMSGGMDLYDALLCIGFDIKRTPKKDAKETIE